MKCLPWANCRVHLDDLGWNLWTSSFRYHCHALSHTPVMAQPRVTCTAAQKFSGLDCVVFCFHPGLSPTQAQLESMPGPLSRRNGLSSSLLRARRKRRNTNIDLFGMERSMDWGNREIAIIKLARFCDLLGQRASQCVVEKADEVDTGRAVPSSPSQNNKAGSQGWNGRARSPQDLG